MFQLLLIVIYLAFIGLGLPDALLGAAWPSIYREFSVPVSYMGGVSMIIAAGTIISSLASDRLTRKFGAGKVTFVSVLLTAAAILGFSLSGSYGALCFWAVPYGLGAGSVDAALNNYVALHYASRHMSWLHCMWGVGASVGPYVMGWALGGGHGWSAGYACIAMIQTALASVLFFSLPLWKKASGGAEDARGEKRGRALSLPQILKIRGAKEMLAAFCCYSALEQTAGLWASSYLVLCRALLRRNHCGARGRRLHNGKIQRRADDTHRAGRHSVRRCGAPASSRPGGRQMRPAHARPRLRASVPRDNPLHAGTIRRGQVAGHDRRRDGMRLHRHVPRTSALRLCCRTYKHGAAPVLPARGARADVRPARKNARQSRALFIVVHIVKIAEQAKRA